MQGSWCLAFHTFLLLLDSISACILSHNSPPPLKTQFFICPYYQYSLLTSSHHKQLLQAVTTKPPHYEHKIINLKDSGVILSVPEGSISPLKLLIENENRTDIWKEETGGEEKAIQGKFKAEINSRNNAFSMPCTKTD